MLKRWIFLLLVALATTPLWAALTFDNSFYSTRNRERPIRKATSLIILHTTEAPSRSALRKLSDLGECHYCISESGRVYRIIDHRREAYHAGRSMWNGRPNVDSFSVGIEVCGYHNKPLAAVQIQALSELIGELKYIYKIPDHAVLAHSHVAYGAPNKWHTRSHRGRKRCGMMFALPAMRKQINLKTRPAADPDVKAKRLVVGDPYLAQVLYGVAPASAQVAVKKTDGKISVPLPVGADSGTVIEKGRSAWDIARDAYNDPTTLYTFPDGSTKAGHQIADFKLLPVGTRVAINTTVSENRPETFKVIGTHGSAREIAGDEIRKLTTIYICPDGRYFRGSQITLDRIAKLPHGTRVLVGYALGGPITAKRPASSFSGNRWRAPDTFFLLSKTLVPGNRVDDSKIPSGTVFFYKN